MTDKPGSTDDEWVRTTFLRRLAHDIVGGAGVARGALDEIERAAQNGGVTTQQQTFLGIARRSVTKLERIARRLRFVALAEAGELAPARTKLDLRDVVDRAVAEASELDGRRTVKVDHVRADTAIVVQADPEQLFVALSELTSNAIRFARSRVRLVERHDGTSAVVIIDDDGPGFPAELSQQLRPRLRTRDGQRGLGASLPIALDIAQGHGGSLDLGTAEWDDAARGARARVILPC